MASFDHLEMPKQSDVDFANLVLNEKLATRQQVDECLDLLKNLKEEAGVEDSLDGIMCLKGIITEAQANVIWKKIASGEVDDIIEGIPPKTEEKEASPARAPAKAPEPAGSVSPYPSFPGTNIVAKLEKDSTGLNYLSEHGKNRKKIVHVLYPQTAANEKLLKWLTRQGQALSKLNNPAIAKFDSLKVFENRVFFAQEIPSGELVASIIEEEGSFPEEKAIAIFTLIGRILQHAESVGFVHGRLTPQNIYITHEDDVEMRFFTSLEREIKIASGKPDAEDRIFLPPDAQKPGEKADAKSDLYSSGMVLLYLLAGPKLLDAGPAKVLESLSPHARKVAARLVERKPEDRYDSFESLLKDLEHGAGEESGKRPAPAHDTGKLRKKGATGLLRKKHPQPEEEPQAAVEEVVEVEPIPEVEGEPAVVEEAVEAEPERKKAKPGQDAAALRRKTSARTKTREAAAPKPEPEPEPEKPAEEPPDPRYQKKMEAAEAREAKGDYAGAVEKLNEALEFAPNKTSHRRRIEALTDKAYKELSAEADAKDEAGDFEEAISLFEKAKSFAQEPAEVDRIVEVLKAKIESGKRSARLRKAEENARVRADKGDVSGAIDILRGAKDLADNPAAIQAKIEELAKAACDERIAKSREAEDKGQCEEAVAFLEEARKFTAEPGAVDEIIESVRKRDEEKKRREEYSRLEASAKKSAEEGNIEAAIGWLEKAKVVSPAPVAVQARIDNLKADSFKRFMALSQECQAEGKFIEAVEHCEKARPWTSAPEEVDAAIEAIKAKKEETEKKKRFDDLKKEADGHETSGDLRTALEKMYEASEVSDSTVSARMKIDTLKKKIFDEGVSKGRELEKEGKYKLAIKAYEEVAKYASSPKSVELLIATAKREYSRHKKEAEFKRIESEARAKLKGGDYKGAIEVMETAREFAESHITFDAKIDGLKKAAFDSMCAKAKELEAAGEWSEAVAVYEKARPFADSPDSIDGIISTIKDETDKIRRKSELDRRLADAADLAAKKQIKNAVQVLEEAKQFSANPAEIQTKIDKLLVESMVEKLVELASQKEASGDVPGAVAACEKAMGFKTQNKVLAEMHARLTAGRPAASDASSRPPEEPKAVPAAEEVAPFPAPDDKTVPTGRPMSELLASLPPISAEEQKEVDIPDKRPSGEAIKVTCKTCKKVFLVKREYEGKKGKCPKCKSPVQIPMQGKKVVCFLCEKVLPEARAKRRGDEYYCPECDEFIGGQ